MSKAKLILLEPNGITEEIIHSNAFIKPNGSFYLAKGYTANNPNINLRQLESSALSIIREEIGYHIKKDECVDYFQALGIPFNLWHVSRQSIDDIIYLKSLLVEYYGYSLFARRKYSSDWDKGGIYDGDRFVDASVIPNPIYYGNEVTSAQVEVFKKLFDLNDDGSLLYRNQCKSTDDVLNHVLRKKNN